MRLEASPTHITMGGDRRKLKAKGKRPVPSVNHQERIPDLRAKYQECMERPEYWWIQDEVIATIGKALEQRNFVVSDNLDICRVVPRHARLVLVLKVAIPNQPLNLVSQVVDSFVGQPVCKQLRAEVAGDAPML